MKVIDLLNLFNGPWHIYEPVRNAHGELIDTEPVCSDRSPWRVRDKYLHRTVHDFTGCIDFGINIYLND